MTTNFTLNQLKASFQKEWDALPADKRPTSAGGIITAQLTIKHYDPLKQPTEYKELYNFIFERICLKRQKS